MAAKTKARSRNTSPNPKNSGKDSIGKNSLTIENEKLRAEIDRLSQSARNWRNRYDLTASGNYAIRGLAIELLRKLDPVSVDYITVTAEKVAEAAAAMAKSLAASALAQADSHKSHEAPEGDNDDELAESIESSTVAADVTEAQ